MTWQVENAARLVRPLNTRNIVVLESSATRKASLYTGPFEEHLKVWPWDIEPTALGSDASEPRTASGKFLAWEQHTIERQDGTEVSSVDKRWAIKANSYNHSIGETLMIDPANLVEIA